MPAELGKAMRWETYVEAALGSGATADEAVERADAVVKAQAERYAEAEERERVRMREEMAELDLDQGGYIIDSRRRLTSLS